MLLFVSCILNLLIRLQIDNFTFFICYYPFRSEETNILKILLMYNVFQG